MRASLPSGFSVAWLYWYFWVIIVGFEAIAGAKILQYWIDAPLWLMSLILMLMMTATNLYSVKAFGEFEYWFAGIKVATPKTVMDIAYRALHMHGSLGVSNEMPFVRMMLGGVSLGLADGPTEVHKWSLAKKIKRDWKHDHAL